jgi:hypothetical protein
LIKSAKDCGVIYAVSHLSRFASQRFGDTTFTA